VERTFSPLNRQRWLNKGYERLTATCEAFVDVSMISLMQRRLAS